MDITLAFAAQLSQQLRSLRKSRGLSQTQLAAKMGVAQSRIASIEKDATKLTATQLLRWLSALDTALVLRTQDKVSTPVTDVQDPSLAGGQW